MAAKYRLFGSNLSPYSVKVRSYLRYKKLPFDWVAKGFGTEEEFQSLARSQALPMLVSPKGGVAHDSSTILSQIEAKIWRPSARPNDPACAAVAILLEDYADEWLNKVMFHYRWGTAKAAKVAATRQADFTFQGFEVENRDEIEKSIAKSMTGRLKLVGSTKKTGPILEASFERFLKLLNAHLEHHLFIFGGHPSFADFALAGQLIQLLQEEVPGAMIRDTAPFVAAWCEFMEEPRSGAPFEKFATVSDTLLALVRDEVAVTYLPWAEANAESIAKKRKTISVSIAGEDYKQGVQAHSAAAYEAVKAKFAATSSTEALAEFLKAAGLAEFLPLGPEAEAKADAEEDSEAAEDQNERSDAVDAEANTSSDDDDTDATDDTDAPAVMQDVDGEDMSAEEASRTDKDA